MSDEVVIDEFVTDGVIFDTMSLKLIHMNQNLLYERQDENVHWNKSMKTYFGD